MTTMNNEDQADPSVHEDGSRRGDRRLKAVRSSALLAGTRRPRKERR